jgi:hypothetical protein
MTVTSSNTFSEVSTNGYRRGRWARAGIALIASALLVTWGVTSPAPARASTTTSSAPSSSAAPSNLGSSGTPDFGPNVHIFTPSMPQAQIQSTVDAIATAQISNQFGQQRYALLFEPGTYGSAADPLTFQVGYYTEVAGLGADPSDVTINGAVDVENQCFTPTAPDTSNCTALDNFWRSLSNMTINITGQSGCQSGADFWAVSQAAPMRRMNFAGGNVSLFDYCSAGPQYASGGYIADSAFAGGTVINGSQQQFIVRNSSLDGWSNGVWNQVFAGDIGAPAQSFGTPGGAPYTTLATSPVTQEEPFLYSDSTGQFRVFVPALQHNSSGTSWSHGSTAGTSIPISKFFIATPTTSVLRINLALALGQNLILTPGVYDLPQAIAVRRPDTVVMGLGFATLIPTRGNEAMHVSSVPGVKLSGMIFDAGAVNSNALLTVGDTSLVGSLPSQPTLIQDVFFRIGGAEPGKATNSLVVNSSNTILDDVWAWRADHGAGVGWTANTAATGLLVNGNNVTAYGLAVEHFQKNEVVWNGQNGTDIFFQNEMPYDVPSQAAWMQSPTHLGYPALAVAPWVKTFTSYGIGSYSFFDQGIPIESADAFQVPQTPGVQLHDSLTVFLNGSGGIQSVVNGVGAAVDPANGGPSDVTIYQ